MTRLVDKDDFVAYVDSALHTHTESVSTSIFMRSKKKKNPVSAKLHACAWRRAGQRHVSTMSYFQPASRDCSYYTHLPNVIVAVVLEGHGDRVHQHMAQYNKVAYHELLDSAGHDQDGKADQPELPPQYQQLPPHEGRFVVTAHP